MSAHGNNVLGSKSCSFQYFISKSTQEYRAISAQIQRDIVTHIGDARNTAIDMDETGFPKQGNYSIGIKRQYSCRPDNADNCQMAAGLSYINGSQRNFIDAVRSSLSKLYQQYIRGI
jgi:SRSO17 transposase